MKAVFKRQVVLAIMFLASIFFILSSADVAAYGQAEILPNHTGYLDSTTIPITYHVAGEIDNVGNVGLSLLNVTATFYSQDNSLIGSRSSYAFLDVLLPGRTTPFEVVWVGATSNQIHNYSLTLKFSEYTGEKPLALQILKSVSYTDEAGFHKVNGTIKNMGTSNATYVEAAATFYNSQGKVVGVTEGFTDPSTIMPNQTELFDLELRNKADNFSSYRLTAESTEYAAALPETATLTVLLNLNATMVNSGYNASVQVHVANGTLPVKDASVQLASDKGGTFKPQSGYTNSDGNFTATFTVPTVTNQTSIAITASATKTGYILGQSQKQITVNPSQKNGEQPDSTLWTYLAATALVVATLGAVFAIARRKRHKPKARTRSHILIQQKKDKFA